MAKKPTLEELNGPLSDEEMKNHLKKVQIIWHWNGNSSPLLDNNERILREVLYYRSRPRLIITMDEHHSSMGTSPIARCKDDKGVERHIGTDFPMAEMGFDTSRGQRFMVTVDKMTPDKSMKPRKNPFQKLTSPVRKKRDVKIGSFAPKTFFLNEQHTTHVTKTQARSERADRKRVLDMALQEEAEALKKRQDAQTTTFKKLYGKKRQPK